jgi:hypothetical protein
MIFTRGDLHGTPVHDPKPEGYHTSGSKTAMVVHFLFLFSKKRKYENGVHFQNLPKRLSMLNFYSGLVSYTSDVALADTSVSLRFPHGTNAIDRATTTIK